VALFHYPKTIHKRTEFPKQYKRYQAYKKYLQIEFNHICVYCRMPDFFSEVDSYAVEHYRPINKFPELETEYTNLYYSCCQCNSHKGKFWPTKEDDHSGRFIPNPCDHLMHKHLRAQADGSIKPHSSTAGVWTVGLLDLNAPRRVEKRLFYLTIKKKTESAIVDFKKQLAELKEIEKTIDPTKLALLQDDIVDLENELLNSEAVIKRFDV